MDDEVAWQLYGLCHVFTDVDFVPDPFLGQDSLPAKNVCLHCPVRSSCLDAGMTEDRLGVWGGTDELDRVIIAGSRVRSRCDCADRGELFTTTVGTVCTSCGNVTT